MPSGSTADSSLILRCREVTKHYGGVAALTEVDLQVKSGRILGLIGPNGAGKTTLFDVISGFNPPTSGAVFLDGDDVTKVKPYRLARRGIARTFQTQRLFPSLTIWETVLLSALTVEKSKEKSQRRTVKTLTAVGFLETADKSSEHLPPGQRRLLEIGRALTLSPQVLLLDEAMAAMTPVEIARVHEVLKSATSNGCAVIAIEHVLPAIAPIADRVQVLDFGKTIAEGAPADVLRDPLVVEAYLGVPDTESTTATSEAGAGGNHGN